MKKIICIDAGHGGVDPGAVYCNRLEKTDNLALARILEFKFLEQGFDVVMTRDADDKTLSSVERTNIVKGSGAPCCLSLHRNAGGDEGAEIWRSIYSTSLFAGGVLENILLATGYKSRGVKSKAGVKGDYYYMHRLTGKVETLIVEVGFIDNQLDNDIFDTNIDEIATGIVIATCDYYGVEYKEPTSKTMYRVVTGSFRDKENAERRVEQLRKLGFDSFIHNYLLTNNN